MRVIAETIASLPVGIYETTDTGNRKASEHPLHRLLHDEPNPEMTSFIWRETVLSHLLLWGNSYNQIIRSGKTSILGLYPLLPDRMEVDRDTAGKLTYKYTTTEGASVQLKPEDVLHIPGLGFDGIMVLCAATTNPAWSGGYGADCGCFHHRCENRIPECRGDFLWHAVNGKAHH